MLLKQKLLTGQKIFGTMLRVIRNPAIYYIVQRGALDFVMYDCEHSDYNMETLHDMFITGNALGIDSFLRTPILSKDYISRALDLGAHGVMVPMLETPKMAKEFVNYSKYPPLGRRGFASGIAHINYDKIQKHTKAMKRANNSVISIAQIETEKSVNMADNIAATPGIDALLIGPNDLSISLGFPGDIFNTIQIEAIEHVAVACKKNKKSFGMHADTKLIEKFIRDLDIVLMGTDVDVLTTGFMKIKQVCKKASIRICD